MKIRTKKNRLDVSCNYRFIEVCDSFRALLMNSHPRKVDRLAGFFILWYVERLLNIISILKTAIIMSHEKVRAKFECQEITETLYNKNVKFRAIQVQEGDNADFTDATPEGEITVMINKEAPASKFFKVGKHYNVDFEEAED